MKIVKINSDGLMDNIDVSNIDDIINPDIQPLYKWKYNNCIIECYGCLNENKGIINIHKLPGNGISNILEIESNDLKLYGNIYIKKSYKNKLKDLNISEYGEFYCYLSEYYNHYEESSESESELDINNIDDVKIEKTYEQNINKICKSNKTNKTKIKEKELDNDYTDYFNL